MRYHVQVGVGTHRRHDLIRNILNKKLNEAGYETKFEQKYEMTDEGEFKPVHGVPGDILVYNWDLEGNENERNLYIDITVGNIFDSTYINNTSKKRAWLMDKKEKDKSQKYDNAPNVKGLAFEVMGGMSKNVKAVLQRIAAKLEDRTNIVKSIQMDRLRTRILAIMMKQQANQVLKCYNMHEV